MTGLPLREVAKGSQSAIRVRERRVVEDAEAWALLWERHDPRAPVPVLDFGRERVLAVFMGERSTGGYSSHVERVVRESGRVLAIVHESEPPAGAMVTMVLTAPFHIVAVPAGPEPVEFRDAVR